MPWWSAGSAEEVDGCFFFTRSSGGRPPKTTALCEACRHSASLRNRIPSPLMDPEYRRDVCGDFNIECESVVLSSLLAPVMVCGSRGMAEDKETRFFRHPP